MQQCEIQGQKEFLKSLQELVTTGIIRPWMQNREALFDHAAATRIAAETDVEGKENTARQLLQPGSCLERGSLWTSNPMGLEASVWIL